MSLLRCSWLEEDKEASAGAAEKLGRQEVQLEGAKREISPIASTPFVVFPNTARTHPPHA